MNVVISGASKGFGKSIAELFASKGHNLFLCSRNAVSLYNTVDELITRFPSVTVKAKPFDLSLREQAKDFGTWSLEKAGRVDILVNNAGVFYPGSVYNEDEGLLEQMIGANLYSAYHLTRTLVPAMIGNKSGHIFNMCSIASFHAYKNGGAYSISKFALAGFSKNLREEMKPFNVKVTTIYSGAAYTDSWSGSGVDPERIMKSSDIADIIYSCSQLSPQACPEDIVIRPQLGDL